MRGQEFAGACVRIAGRCVRVGGAFVLGVLLIAALAAAALVYGGPPALKWAIVHPGSSLIGRAIVIDGPVQVHWGDPSRVVINGLHVANARWGGPADILTAKRVELSIYVCSLVFTPVRIPVLTISGGELHLEKSPEGVGNWTFGNPAPSKRTSFPLLKHFEVKNSTLSYLNQKTKQQTRLALADLTLDEPSVDAPARVTASGELAGSFAQEPVKFEATFGPLASLRNPAKPYPVKINGSIGDVAAVIDGTAAEPLDFNGLDLRLSLSGSGIDHIAAIMGVPMPELPPFRGTGVLKGGLGKYQLNALTLKTGVSDLDGGLDIDTTPDVPRITANLTSSRIALGDFKGLYGGKPEHAAPTEAQQSAADARVIPATKIETKKLPGIDLALNFYGTNIESAGGLPFERVTLGVRIHDGELAIDPLTFHVALGDVSLHAIFDPFTQTSPPRLRADIDIRHVDLHRLLSAPSKPPVVRETAGNAGGFVKLETTGASLREFAARMNGDAGLFVENGKVSDLLQQLAPVDVLRTLGVLVTGDKPQPLTCLVTRFDIKSGVATASTMLAKMPDTTIIGSGDLDFRNEALNFQLKPYNNGFTLLSLRTPIDIGGTLKKPTFQIEKTGLVAKLAAAVGLGVLFPPAAILPLIDTGLGPNNACHAAYAAQRPPGQETTQSGSSAPGHK